MISVSGGLEHGTSFVPATRLDAFKLIDWLEEWIANDMYGDEMQQVNAAYDKKVAIMKKSGKQIMIPCKVI